MVGIPTIGDRHHSISRDLHLDFSGFPLWDRWPYRIYCGPLRMWTRSSNMFHQPLRGASMSPQTSSGVDEIDGWVTVSWTHHSTKSFDDWYIPRVLWIAPAHTHTLTIQADDIHPSILPHRCRRISRSCKQKLRMGWFDNAGCRQMSAPQTRGTWLVMFFLTLFETAPFFGLLVLSRVELQQLDFFLRFNLDWILEVAFTR